MGQPPETTFGAFSWSTIILGLQCIGAFPYTVSKTNTKETYKFSNALFLWSIFSCSVALSVGCIHSTVGKPWPEELVGEMVFRYSSTFLVFFISSTPIIMMLSCRKLAALLTDLCSEAETKVEKRKKWYKNMHTLMFMAGIPVFQSLVLWTVYSVNGVDSTTVMEVLFLFVAVPLNYFHFTVPFQLFEKITDLLTRQLASTTKATVDNITAVYVTRNEEQSDSQMLPSALHILDRKVLKVSHYQHQNYL